MSLERSLKGIAKKLNKLKMDGAITGYALIGGLSVATWGFPRGTKDIDVLVSLVSIQNLELFSKALEAEGLKPEIFRGGQIDPVPYIIRLVHEDVPVDMLIVTKKWEDEAVTNAVYVDFHGVEMPVIPLEYLIAMKLKAGGPRDLLDAEELLKIGGADSDMLESLAKRLRVNKRLERIRGGK